MSESAPNLTTDEREQLVAYLDGELPEDRCIQVEDRLASDAAYRSEMQRLARAWDALDELPQVTAGEEFAKTTIEMVTVAAEEELTEKRLWTEKRRFRRIVSTLLLMTVMIALGFFASRRIWPNPNQLLLADLPVIEHLDAYMQFRQVAFLRKLAREFEGAPAALGADELQSLQDNFLLVANASTQGRREYIDALEPEAKEDLASRFARFTELSPSVRTRLRQVHQEIVAAKDAPQLVDTMALYMAWLENLSAGKRAELRELAPEKRLEQIAAMIRRNRQYQLRNLSATDLKAIRETVIAYGERHRDELIRGLDPKSKIRERFHRNDRRRLPAWWLLLAPNQPHNEMHLKALHKQVEQALSEDARRFLSDSHDDRVRESILHFWISEAIRGKRSRPWATHEELEAFFAGDELPNDQKEKLLAMPRDQVTRELQRLYYQNLYGGWIGFDWTGRSRRGGGRPGTGPPRAGERENRHGGNPPEGTPRGRGFRGPGDPVHIPSPVENSP